MRQQSWTFACLPFANEGNPRSDNGPEFVAKAVQEWIAAVGAKTAYIERGSPWETDVIDKRFLGCRLLCCRGARATAWGRAGFEVRALPRSHYCRSSFAALVRTLGPLRFQPAGAASWRG